MRSINLLLYFTGSFIIFSSCNTDKRISNILKDTSFSYSYCSPTVPYQQSGINRNLSEINLAQTNISEHDQLMCRILGISGAVDSLWLMSKRKIPADYQLSISLKQGITAQLFIAQSQLQAVAAELDCEGERSNMAAMYLDAINNRRKTNLTVASVIAGAVTTVGTVAITEKPLQTVVAVAGGLLSAGLGALTINPKGKKIKFYTNRNLLEAIFMDCMTNKEYPYFVWLALHQKALSNKGNITLSESLKSRWLQFEFNGKLSKKQEALFFGGGGYYTADDLHTRAAMINQLQSTIRSLYQDLSSTVSFTETL